MNVWLIVVLPLAALYGLFHVWYGGNGQPMSAKEIEEGLRTLQTTDTSEHGQSAVDDVRQLLAKDDGKEFVMQNLVRYRPKALYPPGTPFGDDPREADKRYGKLVFWPLLKNGNLMLFIGRRSGNFLVPEGADAWHYVAMVRYRSRRDFLRFAIEASTADIFMHKWAAIEKTHVFPVQPIWSLFMVRMLTATALGLVGIVLMALSRLL